MKAQYVWEACLYGGCNVENYFRIAVKNWKNRGVLVPDAIVYPAIDVWRLIPELSSISVANWPEIAREIANELSYRLKRSWVGPPTKLLGAWIAWTFGCPEEARAIVDGVDLATQDVLWKLEVSGLFGYDIGFGDFVEDLQISILPQNPMTLATLIASNGILSNLWIWADNKVLKGAIEQLLLNSTTEIPITDIRLMVLTALHPDLAWRKFESDDSLVAWIAGVVAGLIPTVFGNSELVDGVAVILDRVKNKTDLMQALNNLALIKTNIQRAMLRIDAALKSKFPPVQRRVKQLGPDKLRKLKQVLEIAMD